MRLFPFQTLKKRGSSGSEGGGKEGGCERDRAGEEGRRRSRWKGSVGGEKEAVEGTSTVRKSRREVEREEVWEEEWVKSSAAAR